MASIELPHVEDGGDYGQIGRISGPTGSLVDTRGEVVVESGAVVLKRAVALLLGAGLSAEQCGRLAAGFAGGFEFPSSLSQDDSECGSGVSSRSSRRRAARAEVALAQAKDHNALLAAGELPFAALFRTQVLGRVRETMAGSRTLGDLARLPRAWFLPAVAAGSGPTVFELGKGFGIDVGRSEGEPLLEYLLAAHSMAPAFVHPSWRAAFASAVGSINVVSLVGEFTRIELSAPAALAGEVPGYCYLKLFPEELRVLRCAEFGSFPSVGKLAWAVGSRTDTPLVWDGESTWHVVESGRPADATWGQLIALVRRGVGFSALTQVEAIGHRVGAEDGQTAFRGYLRVLEEVAQDEQTSSLGHVTAYAPTVDADGPVLRSSREVTPVREGVGCSRVDVLVPMHGVVLFPAGVRVLVGDVVLGSEDAVPRAALVSRGARFRLLGRRCLEPVFVKVLSRDGWQRMSMMPQLLPVASSVHRLAYLETGPGGEKPVVVLVPTGPLDETGALVPAEVRVLHDPEDAWLATTRLWWRVEKAGWYEVSTTEAVVLEVVEGDVVVGPFTIAAGGRVVLTAPASAHPFRSFLHSIHLSPVGNEDVIVHVVGIADTYSFDGGGPSDGECCSGEEY